MGQPVSTGSAYGLCPMKERGILWEKIGRMKISGKEEKDELY